MRAVVYHDEDHGQTICLIKGGELSIQVTSMEGETLQFVVLDRQTTLEVFDMLRDEFGDFGEATE